MLQKNSLKFDHEFFQIFFIHNCRCDGAESPIHGVRAPKKRSRVEGQLSVHQLTVIYALRPGISYSKKLQNFQANILLENYTKRRHTQIGNLICACACYIVELLARLVFRHFL